MSDLKVQGVVEMSTEGVERALDRVGDKAGQMASRLSKEADKAGKAAEGIGEGADKGAEKFTRAEARISRSIQSATKNLELLGKTASQKFEISLIEKGLDASKFEPALVKLRELESVQTRVAASNRVYGSALQNSSYQLQDFIVQVNGGVDASRALGMQLPQLLGGFGAAGAAIGVLAALLPNLVSAFSSSAEGAKDFKEAMSDFDKAIGDVGQATKTFDMDKLYEEFNKSSGAVRAATLEQLNFQREYIKTTQIVASKKFGESLSDIGIPGLFSGRKSATEVLAKDLGITLDLALKLQPALNSLRNGAGDVTGVFTQFGTALLGGNKKAVDLAQSLATLSKSERDAASAASAISEAQDKMSKGHVQTKKEADEASKSRKSVIKESEELAALLDKISGKQSGLDANYWSDLETLHKAYDNGKLSLDQYQVAVGRLTNEQKFAKDADKAAIESAKSRSEVMGKLVGDEVKRGDALHKSNVSLADEIAMMGLSKDQQALYKAAKLDSAAASDLATAKAIESNLEEMRINGVMPEIIAGYEALAEAKRASASELSAQASLDRQRSAKEVAVKAAEDSAKAWEKFGDDINRSLTDALYRAFESGDSFGQAFAKSLKNTFKTMALKLAVTYTVDSAGSLVNAAINTLSGSSGANGGGGVNYLGLANNASTAYSLYNNAGNYGSLAYQWATGSMSTANVAGTVYANATGTGLDGLLATNGAYGTAAGAETGSSAAGLSTSAVGWIAAIVMGMYMSGDAWKKGVRINEDSYSTDNFVETGALMPREWEYKINKALFGEDFAGSEFWAVMMGSSLDQMMNDMIWGGKYKPTGISSLSGTFSEDAGGFTNGQAGMEYRKSGGWFGSSKNTVVWGDSSKNFNDMLTGMYQSVRNTFISVGEVFDDNSLEGKLKGFVQNIFHSNTTNMQASLDVMSEMLAQDMGGMLFPVINAMRSNGEKWSSAFARVVQEANSVSRVFDLMGKSMSAVYGKDDVNAILLASDNIVKLFGSIDQMNASFSAYYGNFYTQSEQTSQAWKDINNAFASLGLSAPKTRAEFRAIVDSLDMNSERGQVTFASLMSLQAAFAALTPTIDDVASAASALAIQNREAQAAQIAKYLDYQRSVRADGIKDEISAAQASVDSAQAIADTFNSILDSLQSYKTALLIGDNSILSPADKYAEAKRAYEDTANKARLGDSDAAQKLQSVADAFLRASLTTGTASSYSVDFGQVVGVVDSVIGVAERQVPIAESQLQVAQDQLTTLNAMLDKLTGNQSPIVVGNYQQAATDWASFFSTTAIGDVVQTAAGAMQRISDSMGMFIDKAGNGFTFSSNDNPYTLANVSDAWRQEMLARYGQWSVPAFASGGRHSGGLRLVGENGPELEITGPSSIINSGDTGSMMGQWESMVEELQALRSELSALREEQRAGNAAIASNTGKVARTLDKFDYDGMPEVRVA